MRGMVRDLLVKLSNAHGVSGSEDSIAAIVKRELGKCVDEISVDRMGNVIAVRRGGNSGSCSQPMQTR